MAFAINNGVKIHYEIEGQGPPLVMQHGLTRSLEMWRIWGYTEELKKDYQLILVDARGHGQSDKPHDPGAYTYEMFAGDYLTILDDLGINKANYFGYSMGAAIGFKSIARYALSRFSSLILGGINPMNYTPETEKQFWNGVVTGHEIAIEQGMAAYIAYTEKRQGRPYDQRFIPIAMANDPRALLQMTRRLADGQGVEEILPAINVPCLVFAATADAFYPGAKEAASLMPNATFVSFPGLDHTGCIASTGLVLPHVKKFLAEVSKNSK
jgi:pimeloyl-ACP methyl ester carboxylesterase